MQESRYRNIGGWKLLTHTQELWLQFPWGSSNRWDDTVLFTHWSGASRSPTISTRSGHVSCTYRSSCAVGLWSADFRRVGDVVGLGPRSSFDIPRYTQILQDRLWSSHHFPYFPSISRPFLYQLRFSQRHSSWLASSSCRNSGMGP